jgi:hypothetical protein
MQEYRQQVFSTISNWSVSGLDNLNAFGPAGSELSVGLESAGYALKYVGGTIEAYLNRKAQSLKQLI